MSHSTLLHLSKAPSCGLSVSSRATAMVTFMAALAYIPALSACSRHDTAARFSVIDAGDFSNTADDSPGRRTVVLDVRDSSAYAAGHVKDAMRVDADEWKRLSLQADEGIEDAKAWGERIGDLGIRNGDRVVIYDGGGMLDASRVWFILQHFGVTDAAVVNGGWPALQGEIAARRIATSTVETKPVPKRFIARASQPATAESDASLTAADDRPAPAGLVSRDELRRKLGGGEWQILDTRTAAEFRGDQMHKNPRGGHLPTARNLPHAEFLSPDGRLKSPEELAEIFDKAGFSKGQPIVTHCESGGRASLAALAALRAGYGPVLNYYRSFADWSQDATCPVERE